MRVLILQTLPLVNPTSLAMNPLVLFLAAALMAAANPPFGGSPSSDGPSQLAPMLGHGVVCPADHPVMRDMLVRYLTSPRFADSRAETGMEGTAPSAMVAVTDPSECALISAGLPRGARNPDYDYGYYKRLSDGVIVVVRTVLEPIRGPNEHGEYEAFLALDGISVYSANMTARGGVAGGI